jgi:hypothetical protein
MRRPIKAALLTLALAGGAFAVTQPGHAQNVSVAVGPAGGIAFGYSDGYWDRGHAWHPWRNAEEAAAWRAENRAHYFEWRHDRDPGMGWREERWWGGPVVNERIVVGPAGGIAFGYADGYWDRAHTWHVWQDRRQLAAWRAENRDHYFEWRHDRDPGMGWREERWWDRH